MKRKPDFLSGAWAIFAILVMFFQPGCRDRSRGGSAIMAYEEGGVIWGWGNLRIGPASPSIAVFLDRLPVTAPSGQQFKLLVADKESGNKTDLFYADWHPDAEISRPVVFASQFFLQNRPGTRGVVDVYVKLKKAGRSWPKALTLAVGTADTSARQMGRYPVVLAEGIKLATIVSGEQAGAVIFHYADIPYAENSPDLDVLPPERILGEGFNSLTIGGKPQWALPGGSQAKLTLVSAKVKALPADQPRLCQERFYAVARTSTKRVNSACQLKVAPVSPVPSAGSWLTCSIFVQFQPPVKESEQTCVVLSTFLAEDESLDQLTTTIVHSEDGH